MAADLLATPPTAELHLHLEGTLEPRSILRMAERNGVSLPTADLDELLARYSFTDLQSFLDLYFENLSVVRTEQDFYELTSEYLVRAGQANVRRAEIFFDPQVHLENGIAPEVFMGGIGAALAESRQHGVSSALIMCFTRHLGGAAADECLTTMLPFRDELIGIGLDSTEIGFPPELFTDVYARAAAEGLHLVAHAGEEGGPETVEASLDLLRIERVDHGIRSMEDPELVARLRDTQVPLTVCPLSNVCLRAVDTLADHPLPTMLEQGLAVCVNSDDPAYFGGYVDDNYRAVRDAFDLTGDQLEALALASFDAAFVTSSERDAWKSEVEAFYAPTT
jgi:adenosine deaminase